jgi:hypothetical protein
VVFNSRSPVAALSGSTFMLQLAAEEYAALNSQLAISTQHLMH